MAQDNNWPRGGVILVNQRGAVLLVKNTPDSKWSFPKGAYELGDCADIMKTAERETKEKVGLLRGRDYQFIPHRYMAHLRDTYFVVHTKEGAEERVTAPEMTWIIPERCEIPLTDLNAGVRFFLHEWA